MKMTTEIKGFDRVERKIDRLINGLDYEKIVVEPYKELLDDNIKDFSKSGTLLRSFRTLKSGRRLALISSAPYAKIQNEGGRILITERMRRKFWALYYETKKPLYKALALTKERYIKIEPKLYTEVSRTLYKAKMQRQLQQELRKLWNK